MIIQMTFLHFLKANFVSIHMIMLFVNLKALNFFDKTNY